MRRIGCGGGLIEPFQRSPDEGVLIVSRESIHSPAKGQIHTSILNNCQFVRCLPKCLNPRLAKCAEWDAAALLSGKERDTKS